MIQESRKLWLRKAFIVLDDKAFLEAVKSGKYAFINAFSYDKMDLPKGVTVREKTTGLIDLKPAEEIIFKKFKEKTRHRIKKTYGNENLKFISSDSNTADLYDLYSEFESEQGRKPVARKEFGNFRAFSAYFEGQPISCVTVIESFPYLRIRSIFSARLRENIGEENQKAISNVSRRIMWEVCHWGKENSFVSLDMASINFDNPKTKSITEFKMSFGVDIVKEYNYMYKSKWFALLENGIHLKMLLRKILRR